MDRYGDGPIIAALSIVEEGDVKKIRMGHLAVIGANKVNGVAAIHTEIIKKEKPRKCLWRGDERGGGHTCIWTCRERGA
eukprot:Skav216752  [mRNA]  locus=scaffold3744:124858:125094:+ [translate_table: standard]